MFIIVKGVSKKALEAVSGQIQEYLIMSMI